MAALHEAEHLPGHAAHLERFPVELPLDGVHRLHDVADGPVAVIGGVLGGCLLGGLPDAGVGLAHHLLAEVHADQVLLEDVVVEHVLGGLAEVEHPLRDVRRPDAVGHVLRVDGTGAVVVAADPADAAGDEVGVARVLPLEKDAEAAEDARGAVALDDLPGVEVDSGVEAEAPDDSSDGVPVHLHDGGGAPGGGGLRRGRGGHGWLSPGVTTSSGSRSSAGGRCVATSVPGSGCGW